MIHNNSRLLATSLAACLLGGTALIADGKTLEQRLEDLEKVVQEQSSQIQKLSSENAELKESMETKSLAAMKEELFDLSDRMDDVEMTAFSDKVKFQLGFQTRADNYSKTLADGESFSDNMLWSTRLRLDMSSDIASNLSFNGRLSMYKYWADSDTNTLSDRDPSQGRRPGSSALYVERAYVDWTMLDGELPLIMTLGRQPSSDGPSHQFKDNTVRKSTYSALAFDGAVDGAVLTANLQPATELDNAALRLVYGKAYQAHDSMAYSMQSNYTGVNLQTSSGDDLDDTVMTGFFLDGAIPGVNNTLVQFGFVQGSDLIANDVTNANNPGMNETLGDFKIYGAMVEATNLLDSGLDLFLHYGLSDAEANGNTFNYAGQTIGMLQSDSDGDGILEDNDGKGSAYWLGMRYTMPFNPDMKLGYEYNHGDEYWYSFTGSSNDLTNKLAARGSAHEVYYIHEINRYANIRLGGTFIDYDYTGSGDFRGAPTKIDDLPTAMQSSYTDKLTNYYLLFNVLY